MRAAVDATGYPSSNPQRARVPGRLLPAKPGMSSTSTRSKSKSAHLRPCPVDEPDRLDAPGDALTCAQPVRVAGESLSRTTVVSTSPGASAVVAHRARIDDQSP